MRRPQSYSDSFLIVPTTPVPSATPGTRPQRSQSESYPRFELTPIRRPAEAEDAEEEYEPAPPTPSVKLTEPRASRLERCTLFTFQGSLHILLISAFETAFYFLYVNRSENSGILAAINTYYQPLVTNCQTAWSNDTRAAVAALLRVAWNQTAIDARGTVAAERRSSYNEGLLIWSAMYSVVAAVGCASTAGLAHLKGWRVRWRRIIGENLLFVAVLALYEVFFFRTVIYNYETLSSPELNQYLVDGLAMCAAS